MQVKGATELGTYPVIWHVLSPGTDPVSGRFVCRFGQSAGSWSGTSAGSVMLVSTWLQDLAHWQHFLGYALGLGTIVFRQGVHHTLVFQEKGSTEKDLWGLVSLSILELVLAEPLALLAQNASLGTGSFSIQTSREIFCSPTLDA